MSKLFQISVDGPNTNRKLYKETESSRKENELLWPIDIISCGLHVIHVALKYDIQFVDCGLKKVLKVVYYLLHDSPARPEDHVSRSGWE